MLPSYQVGLIVYSRRIKLRTYSIDSSTYNCNVYVKERGAFFQMYCEKWNPIEFEPVKTLNYKINSINDTNLSPLYL